MSDPVVNGMDVDPVAGPPHPLPNGILENGFHDDDHEPALEELEAELPVVYDGQVPLGELLSRVAQAIYAELTELAETMPNMSDAARKRTVADWVVKTKKQVVKLYAVAKWARDADAVQKCMNITAFLMNQNRQFEESIHGLTYAKESLDSARLRNHDLLTSLDVLTTGSYQRLPSAIKKLIIPPVPLTDAQVVKTLADMDDVIRFRLRTTELVPVEMRHYRVGNGRVFFTAPGLFEASLSLRGARPSDGWFFAHATFLFNIGGDRTGLQEFPRNPIGVVKRFITDEADARLACYLPIPEDEQQPPAPAATLPAPARPVLPPGAVDAPLARLYNFLQMMSLSYQLEVLWYQAERMRSLGWADYLTVEMARDRKSFVASYWVRKPPASNPARPAPPPNRNRPPALGGTLTIAIASAPPPRGRPPAHSSIGPGTRSAKDRVRAELEERAKLAFGARRRPVEGAGVDGNGKDNIGRGGVEEHGAGRPSDEVEGFLFEVRWEPVRNALSTPIASEDAVLPPGTLAIRADDLDFGGLLRKAIDAHTRAILVRFQAQLARGPMHSAFSKPGDVQLVEDEGSMALRVRLCADEVVVVGLDSRTGRIGLRDTGNLGAAGRGPRFATVSERVNENPAMLTEVLTRLRLNTIGDMAEQKASYLGLRTFRVRNFPREEMLKLGPATRATLYVQLASFPGHYLVLVITDDGFRYALISVKAAPESAAGVLLMEDIGWLDVSRIRGGGVAVRPALDVGAEGSRMDGNEGHQGDASFSIETQVLRELYAYCSARVSYTKVEKQLKLSGIPYTHVSTVSDGPQLPPELGHLRSSLSRSLPALCVQSADILAGAPAAEAAMPNIRVMPLNWWSERKAQVVTCVKLKHVQQPVGKRAGTSAVVRLSKRIIYDSSQAVVSFLSEDVEKCVDEFLAEWAKVSKMVVIAREVAEMGAKNQWDDVRLLSFDLQTVEFAYAEDYAVAIACSDPLSPGGGSYDLRFGRAGERDARLNPHEDMEPFLRHVLRHDQLGRSLLRLVDLLRDTLPVVAELDDIRAAAAQSGRMLDVFAKAAGWHRIQYGDARHALDFRLMKEHRVAILDASQSLYGASIVTNNLGLRPIPGFEELSSEVFKDVAASLPPGKAVLITAGLLCHTSAVRAVARAVHERVLDRLGVP